MARSHRNNRPIREPVPVPEPGADLGFALRQLMQTFRQSVDSELRSRGVDLCFVHGMTLRTLAGEPGISGAQLARRTRVTAQSMNGLLRSMESTGFVVRERHPENRRTDCWYLTAAGLKQLELASGAVDLVMTRVRSSISRADASRLVELLHQCATALQTGADVARPGRRADPASVSTR